LADHLTCVLVAPIGLYGVVCAARESRASTYALAVLGLLIGLVPYADLLVASGPASWSTTCDDRVSERERMRCLPVAFARGIATG